MASPYSRAGGQDGRILTDIFFSKGVEVHAITSNPNLQSVILSII